MIKMNVLLLTLPDLSCSWIYFFIIFSEQEIKIFLERVLDRKIDAETATSWMERTNGWVEGLQLALYAEQRPKFIGETVKTHIKIIRGKLNTDSSRGSVSKAIALKILRPN
jgi:ATP/maltotriose-dependent transcriptional regulator MalT